jgi:hypothetical protein
MKNREDITESDIQRLQQEAAEANDAEMVRLCYAALVLKSKAAIEACRDAIMVAQAQEPSPGYTTRQRCKDCGGYMTAGLASAHQCCVHCGWLGASGTYSASDCQLEVGKWVAGEWRPKEDES